MKIVVLDGYTANPGDLKWDELQELGECEIHDRTPADQTVDRAKDAQIVLTNKTVLNRRTLEQLPALRYAGVLATGYDTVDVAAARERKVVVTNIPAYSTDSVAQHVFALILEHTQHAGHHAAGVRDGRWTRSADFSYSDYPLIELAGLTLGIVGYGRIGRRTAVLAQAFGMKVIVHSATVRPEAEPKAEYVGLDELFRRSDIVSLHCPLNDRSRGMVNAQRLALMKRSAILINTARGPLVDNAALADALNRGAIAGAGLDVLPAEPPPADNPLLTARNCIITPHIAWATQSARRRLVKTAVDNVRAFLNGAPINVVS